MSVRDVRAALASIALTIEGWDTDIQDAEEPRILWESIGRLRQWADKHLNDSANQSCLDRVEGHAKYNEEQYESMFRWLDAWEKTDNDAKREDAIRRIEESPLSVSRKGHGYEVQESWGGPSDGYLVETEGTIADRDLEISRVRYYFRDWFDGAEISIDKEDYPFTWRYVEYFEELVATSEDY